MLLTYLSVEVIIEIVEQFALDGNLVGDETHVVGQLVLCRDDGGKTEFVELRTTGTTEDLKWRAKANVCQEVSKTNSVDLWEGAAKCKNRDS